MKKLILFALAAMLFASCRDTNVKVKTPESETTTLIQMLADKDTVVYKVVQLEDKVYCINTKTKLVNIKVANDSGLVDTLAVVIVIMLLCLIVVGNDVLK